MSELNLDLDHQEICSLLVRVAKESGNIITHAAQTQPLIASKKNTADIVTQTDREVEAFICSQLTAQFPAFDFLGEETYSTACPLSARPTFVVDPIDGTSNFVHGFPAVCISLGLVVDKRPVVGVVYNPFLDELWYAIRGHGAFTQLQGGQTHRLPRTSTPLHGIKSACIGIEWGSDREGPNFELNLKVFTTLARTTQTGGRFANSLRCTGSAAIAICRVAAGQQDAFWECGSWIWDVAAAWCVLVEAGGIMVDGHPRCWNPPMDNRRYLAVRPATEGQKEFVDEFWSTLGNDRSLYGPL